MTVFENELRKVRVLYPTADVRLFPVSDILRNQRVILQGKDQQVNRFVPKLLQECTYRLLLLLNVETGQSTDFKPAAIDLEDSILTPFKSIPKLRHDASRELAGDNSGVLLRGASELSLGPLPADISTPAFAWRMSQVREVLSQGYDRVSMKEDLELIQA